MHSHKDELFLTRLNQHPHLRERRETLLNIVDNAAGDCTKADAAEQAVIEEIHKLGNGALQGWAEQAVNPRPRGNSSRPCRATGKKSLVAYALRGDHSDGTGVAGG